MGATIHGGQVEMSRVHIEKEISYRKEIDAVCEILGKALGYPANPDGTGVCTGPLTSEDLAQEAVVKLAELKQRIAELEEFVKAVRDEVLHPLLHIHHELGAVSGCLGQQTAKILEDK